MRVEARRWRRIARVRDLAHLRRLLHVHVWRWRLLMIHVGEVAHVLLKRRIDCRVHRVRVLHAVGWLLRWWLRRRLLVRIVRIVVWISRVARVLILGRELRLMMWW
jgi:hypothetical protein